MMSNTTAKQQQKIKLQLNCPMPKLDFEVITLGHGSGGLLTNRLLDSGVFEVLSNEWLQKRHDGAFLNVSGPLAFTTDSFVVAPLVFPGGDIGELAVNGTVNDLAMCGAIPRYLSLSFIIEEGLPLQQFWDILLSIRYACEQAGVQVVTGDTKVVEKGKGDQLFVNTSGIGEIHPKADIDILRVQPGDQIIVSGPVATHGMAIMSVREGLTFETSIESDTRNLNHVVKDLLDAFGTAIHLLKDPTRGGVATTLNEVARDAKVGIELQQRAIPIDPQVHGACEILGLDPLYVANEGIFLAIVAADVAQELLQQLKGSPFGQEAAIIGEVVAEHPRQVLLTSQIGGKRVVNMLVGEQLPRIC